jgi:hypothetical protein
MGGAGKTIAGIKTEALKVRLLNNPVNLERGRLLSASISEL